MGFFQIAAGSGVNGCNFIIQSQCQVAFDGGHRCAHFVAGGADEVGPLLLLAALLANVVKNGGRRHDSFVIAEQRRQAEADGYLLLGAGLQESVILAQWLGGSEDAQQRILGVAEGLTLIIDQLQDVLDVDAGSFVERPFAECRCRRIDQSDSLLVVEQHDAVLQAVNNHFETALLVAQITGQLSTSGRFFGIQTEHQQRRLVAGCRAHSLPVLTRLPFIKASHHYRGSRSFMQCSYACPVGRWTPANRCDRLNKP